MWRKRSRVSASRRVSCFRRTWEIKAINICTVSDVHSVHTAHCPMSVVRCPLSAVPLSLVPCPLPSGPAGRCACVESSSLPLLEFSLSARINHFALDTCPKSCQFMALGRLGLIRRSRCLPGACTCATVPAWVRLKVHLCALCFSLVLHATLRRFFRFKRPPKNSSDFNCSLSSVSAGKLTVCVWPLYHSIPYAVSESWWHLCAFYGLRFQRKLSNWHSNGSTSQNRYKSFELWGDGYKAKDLWYAPQNS